jgi:hypothetical protein
MMEFFRAGGFGMWLVLVLGAATLATAIMFARKPDERRMSMIRALSWATLFSISTAVASNLATVFYKVPQMTEVVESGQLLNVTMIGIGESLTPAILGSAFLTLVWLVASVGMRRLSERLSEVPAASLVG